MIVTVTRTMATMTMTLVVVVVLVSGDGYDGDDEDDDGKDCQLPFCMLLTYPWPLHTTYKAKRCRSMPFPFIQSLYFFAWTSAARFIRRNFSSGVDDEFTKACTKSLASMVKLRTVSVRPWRYRRVMEDS